MLPLLGTLVGSGDVVYHLAVFGAASPPTLAGLIGDARLVNASEDPPVQYLLCRASDLVGALSAVDRLRKASGEHAVQVPMNREMLINTAMMRALVADLRRA